MYNNNMNYIRTIFDDICKNIGKKPILVLYGARQVGKTTLVKSVMAKFKNPLYLQGDDPKDALLIEGRSGRELVDIISGHDLTVIDEAQKVKDIGIVLKLIADNKKDAQIIATGSSSFELANKVSEPLTGRNRKFYLYPLSVKELVQAYGARVIKNNLEEYLAFGSYPQIANAKTRQEKISLVKELAGDYLFKDLFLFGGIRNPFTFEKLVKLLALRVGSEISYSELAKEAGISRGTVLNYVILLEQAFIAFRLRPLYTNKTKEINKSHKIYFYDVGIRNALIGNTDPIELRPDKGAIFENFFIAEMIKDRAYSGRNSEINFWRDRQGAEIDLVESSNAGKVIAAYECKWKETAAMPAPFKNLYPRATFTAITASNIVDRLVIGERANNRYNQ